MFAKVGETLRRVRKESGKTLEQLGEAAGLGRGQLSRIENGRQEATFKTLSKILLTHAMSRREFFRRMDLVEAEALALESAAGDGGAADAYDLITASQWPAEVRDILARVATADPRALQARATAQGAVEVGDYVVFFRVLPRGAAHATPPPSGAGGESPQARPEPAPSSRAQAKKPTPRRQRPGKRG